MTKCTCNGMEFICNKWVFTGRCSCPCDAEWCGLTIPHPRHERNQS